VYWGTSAQGATEIRRENVERHMLRRRSDIDPFDEIQMIVLYCRTVIKLGSLKFTGIPNPYNLY
jgi:hypothetical protein